MSIPVTIGFLAGISAHILISQLPAILGLPAPEGPMLQRLATLAEHLGEANGFTLVIGLGVLAIIALSEQIDARIPGALIGLALASAAVVLLRLENRGVSVLGAISVDDAGARDSRRIGRQPHQPAVARPHHFGRRHGADRGNDAVVSDRSQRTAGRQPRLYRRRHRQHLCRTDRRLSRQREPAAHGGGCPKPAAAPRSQALPRSRSSSRCWPSAQRCCTEFPTPRLAGFCCSSRFGSSAFGQIVADLPAVARRISADPGDGGRDHRAADRTGRRARHRAVAAARHLDHDARPRAAVRARARHLDLVAGEPESSRRTGAGRHRRGIPGAAVVPQCLSISGATFWRR